MVRFITMEIAFILLLKFMFSKKATKIDEIFTVDLTVKVEIFLEQREVAF